MDRRQLIRSTGALLLAACSRSVGQPAAPSAAPSGAPGTTNGPSVSPTPAASASPSSSPTATASTSATPTNSPEPEPELTPDAVASSDPAPSADPDPSPTPDPTVDPEPEPAPPPATTGTDVQQICRTSLGLPVARPDDRRHTIAGLMLHHTAVVSSAASQAPGRFRGHANYHRDQGWPDIAYHVGVDLDGNVYGLRDVATPGDTFTEYDPTGWFLVVCEGDFNKTTPTPALMEAVSRVFAHAASAHGIAVETLAGHRDHASTTCPGSQLYGALGSIRDRAAELVANGGVTWEELCGQAGDQRIAEIEAG